MLKNLCIAILVSMVTACGSSQPILQREALQANLRQPCPDLPSLDAADGKTVFLWSRSVVGLYNLCSDLHDKTVQAVQPTQ